MPIRRVYLDLDGVLTDFVSAALTLHGRIGDLETWPRGERSVKRALGLEEKDFWAPIHAAGAPFWSNLEPYPWATELVSLARSAAPMTILTSPSRDPGCLAGKMEWMLHHLGGEKKRFRDFLIGPHKHLLARPDAVLIDDTEDKVDEFVAHGGQAILFPQLWNRLHGITDRIEYVRQELARLSALP